MLIHLDMIDAEKVIPESTIYQDPCGQTTVYQGTYSPFDVLTRSSKPCPVAIKVMRLPGRNEAFPSEILQEIMIQMRLEDCEFICKCYGYFEKEGKVWIVTELMERDLEKDMKMREGRRYAEEELLPWLSQVLTALQYAQTKVLPTQNIAHRDLKPQNLLLSPLHTIKLVDFGSGAVTDGGTHQLTGTPLYMSPEMQSMLREFQRTGILPNLDMRMDYYKADVYALGMTFLHLALFEAPIRVLTEDRDSAISMYLSGIEGYYPHLHYMITYMLQSDPCNRPDFQSLSHYISSLYQSVPSPQPLLASTDSTQPSNSPSALCLTCDQCLLRMEVLGEGVWICSRCLSAH